MNKITWSIFIAVTVGLFALMAVMSSDSQINVNEIDVNTVQIASAQNGQISEHVKGNPDSKIILIEYGDYQCSACATQYPITKAVYEEYSDEIQLVFRNYPISNIHPNAKIAAAAAEAAGLQDKFWEMHDILYENQSDWDSTLGNDRIDSLADLANKINLDVDEFKSDISDSSVLAKIKFDQAVAEKAGITGTPSFYLNGEPVNGEDWSDFDKFKALIDKEIASIANN